MEIGIRNCMLQYVGKEEVEPMFYSPEIMELSPVAKERYQLLFKLFENEGDVYKLYTKRCRPSMCVKTQTLPYSGKKIFVAEDDVWEVDLKAGIILNQYVSTSAFCIIRVVELKDLTTIVAFETGRMCVLTSGFEHKEHQQRNEGNKWVVAGIWEGYLYHQAEKSFGEELFLCYETYSTKECASKAIGSMGICISNYNGFSDRIFVHQDSSFTYFYSYHNDKSMITQVLMGLRDQNGYHVRRKRVLLLDPNNDEFLHSTTLKNLHHLGGDVYIILVETVERRKENNEFIFEKKQLLLIFECKIVSWDDEDIVMNTLVRYPVAGDYYTLFVDNYNPCKIYLLDKQNDSMVLHHFFFTRPCSNLIDLCCYALANSLNTKELDNMKFVLPEELYENIKLFRPKLLVG
jgi:hypothetical protein